MTAAASTLAADDTATASISGDYPNLTLNLGIPQGPTGPSIATPVLSATANTLLPSQQATASVSGDYPNLTLTFGIPQGQRGSDVPIGLNTYGGKYNTSSQSLNLSQSTPVAVDLSDSMPGENVTNTTPNVVEVNDTGLYQLTYSAVVNLTSGNSFTLAVTNDSSDVDGGSVTIAPQASQDFLISGEVLASLDEGASVGLSASTSDSTAVGSIKQATLIVKQFD